MLEGVKGGFYITQPIQALAPAGQGVWAVVKHAFKNAYNIIPVIMECCTLVQRTLYTDYISNLALACILSRDR